MKRLFILSIWRGWTLRVMNNKGMSAGMRVAMGTYRANNQTEGQAREI